MDEKEYLFYEWLILGKHMTEEEFRNLSEAEFESLKAEYVAFCKTLR